MQDNQKIENERLEEPALSANPRSFHLGVFITFATEASSETIWIF